MPVTYDPAPDEAVAILEDLIDRKFPELVESQPDIKILFAAADNGKPPIKKGGNPCAATIKVIGAVERRSGGPDIRILVDAGYWKSHPSRKTREGLVCNELLHLMLKREKDGSVKQDDMGRPMFKCRPDDYALTGFYGNVSDYGDDAPEAIAFKSVSVKMRQALLRWGDDQAPQDEPGELELGGAGADPTADPDPAASAWRKVTIGELGLEEETVDILDKHVIATVGELVAIVRIDPEWLATPALFDIEGALDRFRNRRSNSEIPEIDAARFGEEATTAKAPKPRRGRRAS